MVKLEFISLTPVLKAYDWAVYHKAEFRHPMSSFWKPPFLNLLLGCEREIEIASNLAFLPGISDDNHEVMAVCFEENPNEEPQFEMASNSGDLSEVTMALKCLLRSSPLWIHLIAAESPKSEDWKALLQQIVALDRYRMLSRLQSRHAMTRKATGKQALSPN